MIKYNRILLKLSGESFDGGESNMVLMKTRLSEYAQQNQSSA